MSKSAYYKAVRVSIGIQGKLKPAHTQNCVMQAKRRHTAHAPQRRSTNPKLAQALPTKLDAAGPSHSTVPEAAAQKMPQHISHQQGTAEADDSMQEASGAAEGTPLEGSKRQSGSGQEGEPPQSLWGKAFGLFAGRKAAKEPKAQLSKP